MEERLEADEEGKPAEEVMPAFSECVVCKDLITDEQFYETRIELRTPDSTVKHKVPTHVEHGIDDHINAVVEALRPWLELSESTKKETKPK